MKLPTCLLCFLPVFAISQEVFLPAKESFHLFLLAGQSNMAGRGAVAPEDMEVNPRVLMLDEKGRWVPAVEPMHWDKPAVVGVGPGRTFGIEIAKARPGITVGLIPCAVGGSPIDSWMPGAFDAPTKTHPWDDALNRALPALKTGTLKGILWHQGESDSSEERSAVYEAKLHDLIFRFRRELEAPAIPFLAGQMGRFADAPWSAGRELVDLAHRNLPDRVEATAFVSAEGLNHKGDKVHFDAGSYRELGHRFAAAYLKMPKIAP